MSKSSRVFKSLNVIVASTVLAGVAAPPAARADEPLAEVVVIGSPDRLRALPGSGDIIAAEEMRAVRALDVNELIRRVPGVYARDEEGFGLRPNFGIRGLNPTRSGKVLLLEDGLPLTFAPYGDNASYYHPPVERFQSIEVLKGASQVLFGPQTIGGVVNYITPAVPDEWSGAFVARAGDHGFRDVQARLGAPLGSAGGGWLFDATHKGSSGVRENVDLDVTDLNLKIQRPLGERQSLVLRGSWYDEDSRVPYSGLTLAEYTANPRMNPFVNDRFGVRRWAVSATHAVATSEARTLTTSAYYTYVNRDWWRQSSNSSQRPSDASDPACGGLANLSTTCGNEGRLRQYWTAGVEPRLAMRGRFGSWDAQTTLGARWHAEKQYRVQVNGDTPDARVPGVGPNAGIREDNERDVAATAGFWQTRLAVGRLALTPGLRYERVRFTRENFLNGARGDSILEQWIPGIGATFAWRDDINLFAGMHRGFAPPRVEDVITPAGGAVDLEAELSWNYELGVRAALGSVASLEAAAFRMDFANQIVPASVAGGVGATLTSAGETIHQGAEVALNLVPVATGLGAARVSGRLAYTWLADAEYVGTRLSSVPGFTGVSVSGNRLPYAPEHLLFVGAALEWPSGLRLRLEGTHTSSAFTDDLNTVDLSENGQRGRMPGYTVWNATAEYLMPNGWSFFASVKNVGDTLYVADMSRGLIPGHPRLVQAGFEYRFGGLR